MKTSSKLLSLILGVLVAFSMVVAMPVLADEIIIDEIVADETTIDETEADETMEGTEDETDEDEATEGETDEDEADEDEADEDETDEDEATEGETDEDEADEDETDEDEATDDETEFSDMPDDWSTEALQHAVANGLLEGNKGMIMPAANLTRAEMATIIVRAFGAEVKGDLKDYVDVDENEWYAEDMARAYQMGVIRGTGDKMNPNNSITREEVFAIIARAFKLQPSSTIDVEFSDVDDITQWATGEVYALVNSGYVHGTKGQLNPKQNITRAEFAQVMYNISKQYIQTEGIVTELEDGNVIVNAPGVTLKDVTINGDLIIGDGIGEGEIILENVEVTGRMIVRGGGTDSIIIKGNSKVTNIIAAKVNAAVSVKVQDDADVEAIYVENGSNDVHIEGAVGKVAIKAEDITVKTVNAQIDEIDQLGQNVNIIVDADSTVEMMNIAGQAVNTKVEVAGTVNAIATEAANTQVTGEGVVANVEVKTGADNTKVETPNTEIVVGEDVTGATGAGGEAIEAGTTVKNDETATGIIVPEPTPTTPPDNGGDPGSDDDDEDETDPGNGGDPGSGDEDEDEDNDEDETDPVETALSMGAADATVTAGTQFTMPVTVQGTVADADKDNMVRFYAVIPGLAAEDIELAAIEGGKPAIVTDEDERARVGAQADDLVLAWGPEGGFPLSGLDYTGDGVTTNFTATINAAGEYTVTFVFFDIDGEVQLNADNETAVITVLEEQND